MRKRQRKKNLKRLRYIGSVCAGVYLYVGDRLGPSFLDLILPSSENVLPTFEKVK